MELFFQTPSAPDVIDSAAARQEERGADLSGQLETELRRVTEGCSRCGRCVRDCAFLQRFGTPADLAVRFRAGRLERETTFSCSLCRLCAAECPEGLDPARLFWLMRCHHAGNGEGLRCHRRILDYEKKGVSERYSLFALPNNCRRVFFPGCTLVGTRPSQVRTLFALLQRNIPDLGLVLHCCAKPSHDLGRLEFFNSAFARLRATLVDRGVTEIITACPSCHQVFSSYGTGLKVMTVYELLEGNGDQVRSPLGITVTVHDPCTVRFDPGIQAAIRRLLSEAGVRVTEMEHHGTHSFCCGEGGSACFAAAGLAERWVSRRREETGGIHVVTYCAGCVDRLGRAMPASHIIDFLLAPDKALAGTVKASRPPFTYLNRLLSKSRFKNLIMKA